MIFGGYERSLPTLQMPEHYFSCIQRELIRLQQPPSSYLRYPRRCESKKYIASRHYRRFMPLLQSSTWKLKERRHKKSLFVRLQAE